MTHSIPVITLDGPSGSGKGTIGLLLAKELGWHFLDSGSLYRVLAFAAQKYNIALTEEAALESLVYSMNIQFNSDIFLDGENITGLIRTESCGNAASKIAVLRKVREALLAKQRQFRQLPGLVADGRDMGTVVFPDANLKFFLKASVEERAKRRFFQLKDSVQNVTLQNLLSELTERDLRDQTRVLAPLEPAKDALVIDTTALEIKSVFDLVIKEVRHRLY